MTKTLQNSLRRLRWWRSHAKPEAEAMVDWVTIDHLLTDYDSNRAALTYTPETTQIQRAELLLATDNNELVRAVLRDLDAAEAALKVSL